MDARRHGRPPTSSPSTRANLTLALRIKGRWDDAEPHLDHVMTLTKSFASLCHVSLWPFEIRCCCYTFRIKGLVDHLAQGLS